MVTLFFLGSLRWFLVGACWSGGESRPFPFAARAVALSLPIGLAVTIGLASLGRYQTPLELGLLLLIAGVGLYRTRPALRPLLPGLIAVNLLILLTLMLPPRMEWVVGGWDPGTYLNEGVSLAQEGGRTRNPEPFLQFLEPEQRELFTRNQYGFLEFMPVTPLDAETLETKPFFFPLYPAMIASTYSAGGAVFASRTNVLLGGLALLVFAAALSRFDWRLGAVSAALLAVQPLFIYHLLFPTSEVLHLFLISAILFWMVPNARTSSPRETDSAGPEGERTVASILPLALLFFLGPLNRIDFLLLASVLLVVRALADSRNPNSRLGWVELPVLAAALGLGAFVAVHLSDAAVDRLGKDVPLLVVVSTAALLTAAVVRLVAPHIRSALPKPWKWVTEHLHWGIAAAALLGIAVIYHIQAPKLDQPMIWQFKGMAWYLTWPSILLAALGFLCLEWKRFPAALGTWILALAAMALMVVVFGKIHQTWPWAARRYVPTLLPILAVLGAWAVLRCRWLGLALAVLVAGANAPRIVSAWKVMDDDTHLIGQLQEVANQVGANDLVVCDHFVWSVPLRFHFGLNVINGEQFYGDTRKFPEQLAALEDWPGKVLWLTSTDKGLGVMPATVPQVQKVWEGRPFQFRKVRRATFVGCFTEKQRELHKEVLSFFVRGYEQEASPKRFALWAGPEKLFPTSQPGDILINVGDETARPFLFHGWSRPEGAWSGNPRSWQDHQWVKRLEADVQFDLEQPTPCDVLMRASPIYDKRLNQNIGLFANGTFVTEWDCPKQDDFEVYYARVPASALKAGGNTLTLRVGHLAKGPGKDTRKLGLLVDRILIRPRPPAATPTPALPEN